MLNLIYKDIVIQKKSLAACFLFVIVYNMLFLFSKENSRVMMSIGLPLIIQYLFLTDVFLFDDRNKSYLILNSLPIGRRNIVISRYVSVFVFFIATISFQFILSTLINRRIIMKTDYIVACFIIISVMNATCLPLYFKFGYAKLKYILIIIFFLVCFVAPYVGTKVNVTKILSVFKGISYTGLCAISIFCAIALIIVSLIISIIIYNNKELV